MAGLRWFDLARAAMPLFAGAIPLISFRQVEQALNFERAMGPKWSRPSLKCCRGWEHSQAHRLCFLRCQDVEAKKKVMVFEGITGRLTSPSEALLDLLAFVSWGHHVGPNPSWPWLPGSAPSDWPEMEAAASHPEGQLQKVRFFPEKKCFCLKLALSGNSWQFGRTYLWLLKLSTSFDQEVTLWQFSLQESQSSNDQWVDYMSCAQGGSDYSMQRCNFLKSIKYIHHLITCRPIPTICNESNHEKICYRKCFWLLHQDPGFWPPFQHILTDLPWPFHMVIFFSVCLADIKKVLEGQIDKMSHNVTANQAFHAGL